MTHITLVFPENKILYNPEHDMLQKKFQSFIVHGWKSIKVYFGGTRHIEVFFLFWHILSVVSTRKKSCLFVKHHKYV